jgi:hypothetical protein
VVWIVWWELICNEYDGYRIALRSVFNFDCVASTANTIKMKGQYFLAEAKGKGKIMC